MSPSLLVKEMLRRSERAPPMTGAAGPAPPALARPARLSASSRAREGAAGRLICSAVPTGPAAVPRLLPGACPAPAAPPKERPRPSRALPIGCVAGAVGRSCARPPPAAASGSDSLLLSARAPACAAAAAPPLLAVRLAAAMDQASKPVGLAALPGVAGVLPAAAGAVSFPLLLGAPSVGGWPPSGLLQGEARADAGLRGVGAALPLLAPASGPVKAATSASLLLLQFWLLLRDSLLPVLGRAGVSSAPSAPLLLAAGSWAPIRAALLLLVEMLSGPAPARLRALLVERDSAGLELNSCCSCSLVLLGEPGCCRGDAGPGSGCTCCSCCCLRPLLSVRRNTRAVTCSNHGQPS